MTEGFSTGSGRELELGRLITPPPLWALENRPPAELLESRPGHLRLALTGGVASGKSTVARMFRELGAVEIDFDQLAHRAMEPGTKGFEAAPALFGPEALGADGRLNRPHIGKVIFSEPEKKAAWEAVIHPETWRLMAEELAGAAGERAVVISVPLLFEAGLETFFSPVALVFAPAPRQLERLLARNPEMGEEVALQILANQWPAAAKLRAATHIIDNSGTLAETSRQVRHLYEACASLRRN